MDMPNLEASSSLVGLLKRGRGAGYLSALEADRAVAQDAMLACICGDQSWIFSSFDERHSYYAALGLEIGLRWSPSATSSENVRFVPRPVTRSGWRALCSSWCGFCVFSRPCCEGGDDVGGVPVE